MKQPLTFFHKDLIDYEIDTTGIIYLKGNALPFTKEFVYKYKKKKIEYLIARAFLENKNHFKIVVFKDGNSNNYSVENLEWSSVNQEVYDYAKEHISKSSGKYCRVCQTFKCYSDYYVNVSGNYKTICKDCAYKQRQLKKDEYNRRKQARRKEQIIKSIDSKKRYEKFKENKEAYYKFIEKGRQYRKDNWVVEAYSRLKARARKENLPFNLEKSDLVYPDICPLLGIPISIQHPNKSQCVSWDRIIPELGYVKGNVRAISYKANTMKNDANKEMLEVFSKNIIPYIMEAYERFANLDGSEITQQQLNEFKIKQSHGILQHDSLYK